jgi:hypothetical protein
MFSPLRPTVPGYALEALGAIGAEWEEGRDGVTLVLLPGDSEIRRVTFEPEVAREERQADLVAHGSRFLEILTEAGCRRSSGRRRPWPARTGCAPSG